MKDLQDILESYQRLSGRAALATVVKIRGSAYRRPGARLLIRNDGSTVGAISGGCLEQDVIDKARKLNPEDGPRLAVFDMTAEKDALWGYGQGCNGIIHVLIETLDEVQISKQILFLQRCFRERKTGVIATVFRVDGELGARVGNRVFLGQDGSIEENVKHPVLSAALVEAAKNVLENRSSATEEFRFTDGVAEAFLEFIHPPISLTVLGAGSDAFPVVALARELGWHVVVVDHRPAFAVRERFNLASDVILSRPEELVDKISFDDQSAALVMTHNFQIDVALVRLLLDQPLPRYIGLLGPRKRRELMFQHLKNEGWTPPADVDSRLFNPVGLDIGAEHPEEIALAVLAEVRTSLAKRGGGFMKDLKGPIHPGPA